LSRRVNLPAADDLFRRTGGEPPARKVRAVPDATDAEPEPAEKRGPSGRIKHDEKMTVYVTSDELLEIEHTRLSLRSKHGLAVDRGRLVRVAISLVLADFEENAETSALVRRLVEE
jgi:hypothetical protein